MATVFKLEFALVGLLRRKPISMVLPGSNCRRCRSSLTRAGVLVPDHAESSRAPRSLLTRSLYVAVLALVFAAKEKKAALVPTAVHAAVR